MKAVNTGLIYRIYGDDVQTFDSLPAQSYSVRYDKNSGFYLEKHADLEIKEDKVYGIHEKKVAKVLNSFRMFQRSLGVILSGDKGIGKSLFAKLLSVKAINAGLPLIIVDKYIPNIAEFIESIEQEVVVLFDEFDKTFSKVKNDDNDDTGVQASMLSLFDGVAQGKKLFIVTCNELRGLNDYLINRPGRFHYHFRFEYPSVEEIRAYLKDKLDAIYWDEIEKVVLFSHKINLNYDCLRSIAFELNNGESFDEAIKDLNILNVDDERYDLIIHFENGLRFHAKNQPLDLFAAEDLEEIYFRNAAAEEEGLYVKFATKDCVFSGALGQHIITGDNLQFSKDAYYDNGEAVLKKVMEAKATHLSIVRHKKRDLHYCV